MKPSIATLTIRYCIRTLTTTSTLQPLRLPNNIYKLSRNFCTQNIKISDQDVDVIEPNISSSDTTTKNTDDNCEPEQERKKFTVDNVEDGFKLQNENLSEQEFMDTFCESMSKFMPGIKNLEDDEKMSLLRVIDKAAAVKEKKRNDSKQNYP